MGELASIFSKIFMLYWIYIIIISVFFYLVVRLKFFKKTLLKIFINKNPRSLKYVMRIYS